MITDRAPTFSRVYLHQERIGLRDLWSDAFWSKPELVAAAAKGLVFLLGRTEGATDFDEVAVHATIEEMRTRYFLVQRSPRHSDVRLDELDPLEEVPPC